MFWQLTLFNVVIYSCALCIHNRHFINWIVLRVTWYINVIAINSVLGYIFCPLQPVDLEMLTILTCPLPLNIVNGHEGKPYIHRVIQIAKEPGTEAQLWHGSWLDSTGDARRGEGIRGAWSLCGGSWVELLIICAQEHQQTNEKENGGEGNENGRKTGVQL